MGLGVAMWLQVSVSLAGSFSVEANGGTELFLSGPPVIIQDNSYDTGSLAQPSVTGSANDSLTGVNASADGTAAPGSLGGTTSVSVTGHTDTSFSSQANAASILTWTDEVTVTSATLANNTPVDLLIAENLNVTMTSLGFAVSSINYTVFDGFGSLQTTFNNGLFGIQTDLCSGFCSGSSSAVIHAFVGATFGIEGQMVLQSQVFDCQTTGTFTTCPGSSAQIDAGHTAKLFLDPITTGASYSTASGTTYFSPVPEPSTILLLGFGLVGLAAWGRKRAA